MITNITDTITAMDQSDPPGFIRIEGTTGRVFYYTAPDPTQPERRLRKLNNVTEVAEYLRCEKLPGVAVEGSGCNKSAWK